MNRDKTKNPPVTADPILRAGPSETRSRQNWREWWWTLPKWLRILYRTMCILFFLQIALAVRVGIGLREAGEIVTLRERGAAVWYPWETIEILPFSPPRAWIPTYLMVRRNYRLFIAGLWGRSTDNVVGISLTSGTDGDLDLIGRHFHNLKILTFSKSNFSSGSLRSLSACQELESLDLSYTDLNDEGVQILTKNEGLKQLQLNATLVSDRSIPLLRQLKSLERIEVYMTDLSASAIQEWRATATNSELEIELGSDVLPMELSATIRWSDGRRSANFSGDWHLLQEGPLGSPKMETNDSSQTFLGRNDLSWPEEMNANKVGDAIDGDYRYTLKLGQFASEPVIIHRKNGRPTIKQFEFRMPVTKNEAQTQ